MLVEREDPPPIDPDRLERRQAAGQRRVIRREHGRVGFHDALAEHGDRDRPHALA